MSLRMRRGGTPATTPEPPPDPGGNYVFPTTAFTFPTYPDDGGVPTADGVINVTDYGATGNGTTDDTAAIQSALEQNINENIDLCTKKTIYFPNGTYRLTGLSGNIKGILERNSGGEWRRGLRIQGQSETGTILKLDNNVFTNPADPRFVIFLASQKAFPSSAVPHYDLEGTGLAAYNHQIQDVTINLGVGNTGAIGINAAMHNTSVLRRVTVIGTGSGAGNFSTYAYAGITAERQGVGPGMWERVTIRGCQYGVRIAETMCGHCIEHLRLSDQGTVGVWINTNALAIRGLTSTSTKPVIQVLGANQMNHFLDTSALLASDWTHSAGTPIANNGTFPALALVDAVITGTGAASGVSAIQNQADGGKMFLRNVATAGYAQAAEETTGAVGGGADEITEYATAPSHNLWSQSAVSLNLPIVNTPERPWPTIGQMTEASVPNSGQPPAARVDITNQLQTAIDNCTTDTLYFPSNRGRYYFIGNTTVVVRGNVRHIIGNGSRFFIDSNRTNPLFRIDQPLNGPPVIIEGMYISIQPSTSWTIGKYWEISTPRDVVFQDCQGLSVSNTAAATGRVFINNVLTVQIDFDFPQDVWARQFNADGGTGILNYPGGNFWVLYYKHESGGRAIQMTGGAYEQIGGWHSLITNPDPGTPLFEFTNCDFSLEGIVQHAHSGGNWNVLVRETQGGTTRTLVRDGSSFGTPAERGSGRHLTLVRSQL